MNSKKSGILLVCIGIALILASVGLICANVREDRKAQASVERILAQFPVSKAGGAVSAYLPDPDRAMPVEEIGGNGYIGRLFIPSLELELPVMDDWDYRRMKTAPCRYAGTAYQNNLVICAHNYASHFGRLKNLLPGDTVLFTDMDGNAFVYKVIETENLPPAAVEEMKNGSGDLTLFTCTVSGRARVAVRCRREDAGEGVSSIADR